MVSFSSTLSAMDLKKLTFSDQMLSSPRRKVVSPFGLGIVLSFVVFSALLFNISSKAPLSSSVFQGLYSFGSDSNSSSLHWPFSGVFKASSNTTANVTGTVKSVDFVNSGTEDKVLENAHVGNGSENFEDVSFTHGEASVGVIGDERNGSEPVKNTILVADSGDGTESEPPRVAVGDSYSVKNETFSGQESGCSDSGYVGENSTVKSVENEPSSCHGKIETPVDGNVGNYSNSGDNGDLLNEVAEISAPNNRSFKNCDIFKGKWVRDDSKPYYPPGSCPYIDRDFDCHLNGRPDSEFVKWRWQPDDCDLPK